MAKNKKLTNRLKEHWVQIALLLMLYDAITIGISYFMGLWLRFDLRWSAIPRNYLQEFVSFIPFYIIICIIIYHFMNLYKSIWRFASYSELVRCIFAVAICSLINIVCMSTFYGRMPVSYYFIGTILQLGFAVSARFSYRFALQIKNRMIKNADLANTSNVMIIGAGQAGLQLIRDIQSDPYSRNIVRCIIDDNPNKWNRYVEGVEVVGGRDDILTAAEKYKIDKIFVAIPSASKREIAEVLNICQETNCELKNLPGIYQLVNGEVTVSQMKDVSVEDLLGREPVETSLDNIFSYLEGKVVMVTGGGGSIGSELCRQIAPHKVKQLIIFDIYENNAYDIQLELRQNYPDLNLEVLIGSVRDSRRVDAIFEKYHPDVVYHAAAHKHVPLMEDSPCEAVKNNVMGTYKTARAAVRYGTEKFVLVSTDKAVNPTNIMGASKRLCEMVIQTFDWAVKNDKVDSLPVLVSHGEDTSSEWPVSGGYHTEFVAVRFGNVLGSNGSVIPLFKKQIENGGPVTVTHPDIIRYFMTIPEAVSLILQAGVYAEGGEIFVLDMGEPVKIDTLARNLIKLSGFIPDEDIKIEYTGLRPGEKLYEEKLMAEEGLDKTPNELIHIGHPLSFDHEKFCEELRYLMDMAYDNSPAIREAVEVMVKTYKPTESYPHYDDERLTKIMEIDKGENTNV